MIKSWKIFNEDLTDEDIFNNVMKGLLSNQKQENTKHHNYTKDDIELVEKIRKSKDSILKDYEFRLYFDRFDESGLPFIDIVDYLSGKNFAIYNFKERKFCMWSIKKLEKSSTDNSVWGSKYKWSDLTSISPNISFDPYYLYINGDFFDELERVYYIYYQE